MALTSSPAMPPASRIQTFEDFVKVHAMLLAAAGIPSSLHERLFRKLSSETFDGGNFFSVEACEGGRWRRLLFTAQSLAKESDVFLVDHAWTFRLPDALKQLKEVPGLVERMAALMCVDVDLESDSEKEGIESGDGKTNEEKVREILEREMEKVKERGIDGAAWLELEELGIDDEMLCSLDLSSKFPNLVALNLWGNKLQNAETILLEIAKCRNLKALWLNENPVLKNLGDDFGLAIFNCNPGLEILNSQFTGNAGEWALGFCSGMFCMENPFCSHAVINPLESITVLDLSNRCIRKLPEAFSPAAMPRLSQLNLRSNDLDQHSAGNLLEVLSGFSSLQTLEVDIPGPLGNSAIAIIESLPSLSLLNGVSASSILGGGKHMIDSMLPPRLPEWAVTDSLADRVVGAMWLYVMTYRLADEEKIDETSVWYVMDELGSALRHSDVANFRIAPFLFMPEGNLTSAVSFSVLWPTQDVQNGDECTRDFLFGIGEDKQRSARLTAWFHTPENYFIQEFKKYHQLLQSKCPEPYNLSSFITKSIFPSNALPLRVYTDIPQIEEFLKRPEFVLTNDPKNADIIWTSLQVDNEVKNALGLTDCQYVNQFPFEACLVMKHHLAETIHKARGSPEWLQPTYNLESQLSQLIGDFCKRHRERRDNLWILKPWNMARTIDTTVTGDISAIIRLMETGPKICQKYIERPALFRGKKFDLRYIVLVRSMSPVEVFLADVFWVRLANNPYTLERSSLFEYETHFTVMNYIGRLNHMNTAEFVREFEVEHQVKWLDIHERIKNMIRSVFDSAATVHPEMHNPNSRAMYGVDVMLDSSFMPKLLEVTYCPDCHRACKYDMESVVGNKDGVIKARDFFNTVFGCLFLNESVHVSPL
ncbi:tubulin--tyrosine ligase-like protein 12 [Dioscorea cayenensis subsp. rotundata]|uniref:Tubulin--tyrosine ligase-like protein 12 n=1 Tax=Dioscorea cayennensis subsp. rotundata TaxID=55577 RepID=A0AB40CY18_DIOCR|nr:tubulin--tyrosine ligase-like protein 12 [Dioscorea cayenensis subsp. rotundata]